MLNGQPTIGRMRLSVQRAIDALAVYPNWDEPRREYPALEPDDIRPALAVAAQRLDNRATRVLLGQGAPHRAGQMRMAVGWDERRHDVVPTM